MAESRFAYRRHGVESSGINISAVADNQPTVYIRWVMGITDASWTYCGWNIDDVEILGVSGDADGDGMPDSWEQLIILEDSNRDP